MVVLFCVFTIVNAQEQKPDYRKKLKEALSDVDANGKPKDSLKVLKYYELLKEQLLKEADLTIERDSLENNEDLSEEMELDSVFEVSKSKVLDCELNVKAVYFLDIEKNPKDLIKAVEYLRPCVESGNPEAQLLMGRIYLSKNTEEYYLKAFTLLKKSAKQGNANAMNDLGVLYKYGRGCKLNYNKARKWFKKAAELKNDEAAYSLGYLYLKGFGNINQNYNKAVKWFNKSDHPMAKYWLGICYKNGYGVEKNTKKANEFLGIDEINANPMSNELGEESEDVESQILKKSMSQEYEVSEHKEIRDSLLLGKWKGKILKLDWSGNHIELKKDISIVFQKDSTSGVIKTAISLGNKEVQDEITRLDNSIYFSDSNIILSHESYLKGVPSELTYKILSSDLEIKNFNSTDYLTGSIESYIEKWDESGAPLRFVLKKTESFSNSKEELSDDVLQALSEQKSNFIKLYPNPFENDLIISYELQESANVKVQINDLSGNLISVIKSSKKQGKGKHRYFYDATKLKTGVYIVSVFVNNERKTRITIKK